MTNPHINADAARRFAQEVIDGNTTREAIAVDIKSWFADSYGWPLSEKRSQEMGAFAARVSTLIELEATS